MPLPSVLGSELSPGKPFVTHAPENAEDLVIYVTVDNQAQDYEAPQYGDTFPGGGFVDPVNGTTLYNTYTLVDWQPHPQSPNYQVRIYRSLPGTPITSSVPDSEMDTVVTVTRRKELVSAITEGAVVTNGGTANAVLTVTAMEDSNGYYATKVVTVYPVPSNYNEATALSYTQTMSYTFPARINITWLDLYGTAIGLNRPYSALLQATIKEWWVIDNTAPSLAFSTIIPDTVTINDVTYENVLHDATMRTYNGTPVFLPGTTPDYTTYTGSWVGTQKLIAGQVAPTKYDKIFKVTAKYLTMR
jgi:hypothetical protein